MSCCRISHSSPHDVLPGLDPSLDPARPLGSEPQTSSRPCTSPLDWTSCTTSREWTSDLLPSLAPDPLHDLSGVDLRPPPSLAPARPLWTGPPARLLGSGPQTSSPLHVPSGLDPLHDLSGVDLRSPPLSHPLWTGPPARPLGSGPQTSSPLSPLHVPSGLDPLHDLSGVDLRPPPLSRPYTSPLDWSSSILCLMFASISHFTPF